MWKKKVKASPWKLHEAIIKMEFVMDNQKRLHKADKIYYYIVWVLSSEWNDQNQNIV